MPDPKLLADMPGNNFMTPDEMQAARHAALLTKVGASADGLSGVDRSTRAATPLEHIPAELRKRPQWVAWRYETRAGKRTKVPIDPLSGARAKANDPATWGSYDNALAAVERRGYAGVGYEPAADDPYVFLDLDHCRDAETGAMEPAAKAIVDHFPTYTEASPSGTGLRLVMRGRKPDGARCKKALDGIEIEVYEERHFLTITGQALGEVREISNCQTSLNALCGSLWPPKVARPAAQVRPTERIDDRALVAKMLAAKNGHNVAALYGGDTSAYGDDHSSADQALLAHLAWWTNNDAVQMERVFRSSGLYREKWDRADYRERSITFAIESNAGTGYRASQREIGDVLVVSEGTVRNDVAAQSCAPEGDEAPEDDPSAEDCAPDDEKTEDVLFLAHHRTDSGNALRLIDYCGERVRYCASDSAWYVYDGLRWAQDTTLLIEDLTGEALRGIYYEAAKASDAEMRDKLAKWAARSEAVARRRAAVELARSDRRVAIRPSDLNRDGWLLNCLNGTIDLRSGELRAHDPANLISKLAPVPYDPAATSELWERVLSEATGHDDDYLRHVQRFLGYCLTAEVTAELFAVAIGGTETTKSTVLGPVRKVMGDYAADVQPETFCTKDRVGGTRDDLLRLAGVRLALIPEADKRRHLDEAMLKRFVSGEGWPERGIYQRERDLQPVAKVVFHTNEMPHMSDDDAAVWRRALSWPFTHRPEHIDTAIKPKLLDLSVSGPAILAWLVEGCLAWQQGGGAKKGLGKATTVDQAKDALRRSMNPLADFFDDVCVFDEPLWCSRSRLRAAYTNWCKEGNARRPIGARQFTARVRAVSGVVDQMATENGRGVDGWSGIDFRSPSS